MALPDVVVGIDFGMTSTGVAYSAAPEWMRPETIQNWPSMIGGMIADKVATKITYNNNNDITAWGFLVNESFSPADHRSEELFKLYLDPKFDDGFEEAPPSLQEARKWFVDYLSCLYNTIDRQLKNTVPRYASKRVEFKFSVPTTWKDPGMIAETEQLIRNAGFGQSNPLHAADITLTEAEAAAVYASKQQYNTGDTFLICDAGGGTTDINILKVISSGVGRTELEPLSFVEGKAIGSIMIDIQIEKAIIKRLALVRQCFEPGIDIVDVARQMLRETSRFESFKCNLGDDTMNLLTLRLPIPHLISKISARQASIQDGYMIITKEELQVEFDHQIRKITDLIDSQLTLLKQNHPNEILTFIVLSGGLGSSPYVYSLLKSYYELGRRGLPLAQDVQILRVPKPQLAVCHGLVLDRVQQIKENRVVYKERICRNSYGVICRALYNPNFHFNDPVTTDTRDGRDWVEQHIDWFIVQGQKVSVQNGVRQHYSLKIPPTQRDQPWRTQIVMSTLPKADLPTNMHHPGAHRLCKVESRLPADMKMKNKKWYNTGDKYLRAEFDMRVLVGPADLKFQTISSDGILSKTHEDIHVEWATTENPVHPEVMKVTELVKMANMAELPASPRVVAGSSPNSSNEQSWNSKHRHDKFDFRGSRNISRTEHSQT